MVRRDPKLVLLSSVLHHQILHGETADRLIFFFLLFHSVLSSQRDRAANDEVVVVSEEAGREALPVSEIEVVTEGLVWLGPDFSLSIEPSTICVDPVFNVDVKGIFEGSGALAVREHADVHVVGSISPFGAFDVGVVTFDLDILKRFVSPDFLPHPEPALDGILVKILWDRAPSSDPFLTRVGLGGEKGGGHDHRCKLHHSVVVENSLK